MRYPNVIEFLLETNSWMNFALPPNQGTNANKRHETHETRATWFGLRVAADDINKVGEQSVVQPFCNGDDHKRESSELNIFFQVALLFVRKPFIPNGASPNLHWPQIRT